MTKQEILDKFSDINFVYNDCSRHDTLSRMLDELVEEQEDQEYVEPIPTPTDSSGWFFKCNKCSNPINWKDKFCSMCGKAVKWNELSKPD